MKYQYHLKQYKPARECLMCTACFSTEKKKKQCFFLLCQNQIVPFFFLLLHNKTSLQSGHWMRLLSVPAITIPEFAYVLHCPVTLCTVPQLSFPSFSLCFWICVQLKRKPLKRDIHALRAPAVSQSFFLSWCFQMGLMMFICQFGFGSVFFPTSRFS